MYCGLKGDKFCTGLLYELWWISQLKRHGPRETGLTVVDTTVVGFDLFLCCVHYPFESLTQLINKLFEIMLRCGSVLALRNVKHLTYQ